MPSAPADFYVRRHTGILPHATARFAKLAADIQEELKMPSEPSQHKSKIQNHYTVTDLGQSILDTLAKAGRDPSRLTPEDLAPIDEFHIRGRAATLDLARAAKINRAMTV